jgi:hypothetical protein
MHRSTHFFAFLHAHVHTTRITSDHLLPNNDALPAILPSVLSHCAYSFLHSSPLSLIITTYLLANSTLFVGNVGDVVVLVFHNNTNVRDLKCLGTLLADAPVGVDGGARHLSISEGAMIGNGHARGCLRDHTRLRIGGSSQWVDSSIGPCLSISRRLSPLMHIPVTFGIAQIMTSRAREITTKERRWRVESLRKTRFCCRSLATLRLWYACVRYEYTPL